MNRIISLLGSVGVVVGVASLLAYASIGVLFVVFFGTPDAVTPSNVGVFTHMNQVVSSAWFIQIMINPAVLDVMLVGWLLTFMWAFFHAFSLSYTMVIQESVKALKTVRRTRR